MSIIRDVKRKAAGLCRKVMSPNSGNIKKPENKLEEGTECGKEAEPVSRITSGEDDFSNLANGNRFIGTPPILKNSVIHFLGKDNILYCEENVRLENCNLSFKGNHSVIYLSSSRHEYKVNVSLFHDSVCYVGKDNYFNGIMNIILSEQRHLFIGARGVFSFGIWIRNADPHLVYSAETMERLNPTQSIFIGEHVWIGQSAMILKGSQIGDGSIIGAMSLVAGKRIPPNTSWGGNPVKLLREGIFWDGSCVHTWTEEKTEKSQHYDDNRYVFKDDNMRIPYDEIDAGISEAGDAAKRLDYLLEVRNNFGC